jgi:hypothetical protein
MICVFTSEDEEREVLRPSMLTLLMMVMRLVDVRGWRMVWRFYSRLRRRSPVGNSVQDFFVQKDSAIDGRW